MTNAESLLSDSTFNSLNTIANYSHLITTRPHDIRRVVISDLHLSAEEPALVQAFLTLLDDLMQLPNIIELYILGDWFDAWVGDDVYLSLSAKQKRVHWMTPIIDKLYQLKQQGCQTLVMHGNRDFLLGQPFCDTFAGKLINEPYLISIGDKRYRFEHGDALCTDDISYQRFRRVTRNRAVQWLFLKQPLSKRLKFAQKVRRHSSEDKVHKPMAIMDVNQQAVIKALQHVDNLLHGHTHRPDIHLVEDADHPINQNKKKKLLSKFSRKNASSDETHYRYVLGDWRVLHRGSSRQQVEAVIGLTISEMNNRKDTEKFYLSRFQY